MGEFVLIAQAIMIPRTELLKKNPRLEPAQVKKATQSLIKHSRVEKKDPTAQKSQNFILQIVLQSSRSDTRTHPRLLPLPHPLANVDTCRICVFTKDPHEKYRKLIHTNVSDKITVVSTSQLRSKFKAGDKKRLCGEYDLFFADKSIINTLPPLLGRTFFERKKQPAGIDFSDASQLSTKMETAIGATRIPNGNGSMVNIRIGFIGQPAEEIEENIEAAMRRLSSRFGGWNNIKTIHLKTDFSIALPLYSHDEYRPHKRKTEDAEPTESAE